ncbi:T9SS-dependent choice-of-anchor J family protein [Winogradskyella endarachnes]|uniref:T9SS type A sorting domain-containing protein n=1 Tax=Winogradskyella endarachnes TaxID=2681965 RepID=A0A6L6U679_9FLAO|nr:choice-of-anchor J domain-containing protein [Winogradskyella endarachnes]MUU77735.1 T9SS type A sorting domain-containing protein [Winogradskyella endarachnes]
MKKNLQLSLALLASIAIYGQEYDACGNIETVPYSTNFSSFLPSCWDEADYATITDGPSVFGTGGWAVDGFNNNGTTGAVKTRVRWAGKKDWLISPYLDITPASSTGSYSVSWDMAFAGHLGTTFQPLAADDELHLLIKKQGATEVWTSIAVYDDTTVLDDAGETIIIEIPAAYNGSVIQLAFWIDEGTNGYNAGDGTYSDVDLSIDNFQVIETTAANSCDPVADLDEDFSSVIEPNLPDCWVSLIGTTAVNDDAEISSQSLYANSASNALVIFSLENANDTTDESIILVSPEISNLSLGTHSLSFYAFSENDDIIVGTLSDPNDASTFTALETVELSNDYSADGNYVEYNVDFTGYTGTNSYIGFKHPRIEDTPSFIYLDDITWQVDSSLSIGDSIEDKDIKIYPRITSENVYVEGFEFQSANVFTLTGQKIAVQFSGSMIYTNKLSSGMYIVQLTDLNGNNYTGKFIKN